MKVMKVSEKLALVQRISEELQNRYNFGQAYAFVSAFFPNRIGWSADYENIDALVSSCLSNAEVSVIGEIIDDLGIESLGHISTAIQRPKAWEGIDGFRVFISHLSKDKDKATRLRDALKKYGVSAFVAHEDIEPSLEWQVQIERALHCMELFVSVHTEGYSKSFWSQQELGFAVGKGRKIIALRMGEDPTGFISKHQAISRGTKTAEEIVEKIDGLLKVDDRTKARYLESQPKPDFDDDIPF